MDTQELYFQDTDGKVYPASAIDCRKFICTSGGEGQTGQVVPI
jgi:hypothetical protein